MQKWIFIITLIVTSNVMFAQTYDMKITQETVSTYAPTNAIDLIEFRNTSNFVCGDRILYGGDVYPTVEIDSKCWFTKNLNIGKRIAGTSNSTSTDTDIEKYCYQDKESNCDLYGGLYQWNEAMNYSTTESAQGICPQGWHLPTKAELEALGGNGNILKAQAQGTGDGFGTNTSGFSALLAGNRNTNSSFSNLGNYPIFWCSTESSSSNTNYMYLYSNTSNVSFYNSDKANSYSVRCLKD